MSRRSSTTRTVRGGPSLPSFATAEGALAALVDISRTLGWARHPGLYVQRVLETLMAACDATHLSVVTKNPETGSLEIEVSTPDGRGPEAPADELARQVVESGRACTIPRLPAAPPHPSRTFVSVPLLGEGRPIGALSLDLPIRDDRNYERDLAFFEVVATTLAQAIRITQLAAAHRRHASTPQSFPYRASSTQESTADLVGADDSMRRVLEEIDHAASHERPVLIYGEPGTEKATVARAIHARSSRAAKPFVSMSCAGVPDSLIEARLSGALPGALTEVTSPTGREDPARGGTLLIEGIDRIGLGLQSKIAAMLERWASSPGRHAPSGRSIARIIATTDVDVEELSSRGTFSKRLYDSLKRHVIVVPPLRERHADVLLLAERCLDTYALAHHKTIRRISETAVELLLTYRWPGNVRELEAALDRAVEACEGQVLGASHLPRALQPSAPSDLESGPGLAEAVAICERDLIEDALKASSGNRVQAAKLLKSTERIVSYKVKKYRIDCRRFR